MLPWICPECGTLVFDEEAPCHGCNPPEPETIDSEIEIVDPEKVVRRYREMAT